MVGDRSAVQRVSQTMTASEVAIPTVQPIVDWRGADEQHLKLWIGGNTTVEQDLKAEVTKQIDQFKALVQTLRQRRADAVECIEQIDKQLAEAGVSVAPPQPKRGRPRGKKAEPKGD